MTAATRPRLRNGRDDPEADVDEIQRSYTPTSSEEDTGRVDLVLKVYKGGVVDRFPDGGKMSQYMDTLKVGDKLDIMGPIGSNEYVGKGNFKVRGAAWQSWWPHARVRVGASAGWPRHGWRCSTRCPLRRYASCHLHATRAGGWLARVAARTPARSPRWRRAVRWLRSW